MNCVVIGGAGFLGSHLTEALLNQRHKVVVLDRPESRYLGELAKKGASIIAGDFLSKETIKEALQGAEIVYHFASTTVPKTSNENPIFDVETNLIGAINLFSAAREAGVKKVVFPSSGGTVYGIPKEIPITEDHPTDPISSYGIVKLAIEKYLHWFWTLHGLDYAILRVSNVYGERQPANDLQGVIPAIIEKSLHNQEINIWGDGTVIRDYIHVSDVVKAFIKVSEYQGQEKIFNISNGLGHSVNEIIHMIARYHNQQLRIVHSPGLVSDVPVNILDNSRARIYLNWTPQMILVDGISQTIKYMSDHQNQ